MRLPDVLTAFVVVALGASSVMPQQDDARRADAEPPSLTRSARFAGPFPAQILSVIDGDTVEARVTIWPDHDVVTRIRMAGIDAAEMSATCAEERAMAATARAGLAAMLERTTVRIADVRRDKYAGRVVARLIDATGADIGTDMLRNGYAIAYDGGRRQPWCEPLVTARR